MTWRRIEHPYRFGGFSATSVFRHQQFYLFQNRQNWPNALCMTNPALNLSTRRQRDITDLSGDDHHSAESRPFRLRVVTVRAVSHQQRPGLERRIYGRLLIWWQRERMNRDSTEHDSNASRHSSGMKGRATQRGRHSLRKSPAFQKMLGFCDSSADNCIEYFC